MLGKGKINVEEAERLLLLVEQAPPLGFIDSGQVTTLRQAKYLDVIVGPNLDSAMANGGRTRECASAHGLDPCRDEA